MHASDFLSPITGAILLTMAALAATAIRVRSAYVDRRAMRDAELRGRMCDSLTRRMMKGSIRREWFRMSKLVILLFLICTMTGSPLRTGIVVEIGDGWMDGVRSYLLALIALGLLLNSVLDQMLQRYALSFRLPEYGQAAEGEP